MDINSLLSPDPDPAQTSASPRSAHSQQQAPYPQYNAQSHQSRQPQGQSQARPPNHPRKSSGLSQQVDLFAQNASTKSVSFPPPRHQIEQRQSLNSIAAHNSAAANASRPSTQARKNSADMVASSHLNAGMEALAEVASRQRPTTITNLHEHRSSSSTLSHGGAPPALRSPAESLAPESSNHLAPPAMHSFHSASLSEDDSQELLALARKLNGSDKSAELCSQFIALLHKGFAQHLESGKDAGTYELLRDLRHARAFMDQDLPVGEDTWVQWLSDENILARTLEDRLSLMEMHARSVAEEPYSTQLHRLYGDYMYFLYTCANRPDDGNGIDWPPEDKAIGRQVFGWQGVMDVWEAGVRSTVSHLNDSNLVWDRYIEMLIKDLAKEPSSDKVENIRHKFTQRLLQQPHTTWEQTFQKFSTFMSTYDNKHYEETMVDVSRRSSQIKASYTLREPYESKIQQAIEQADLAAERSTYADYLAWELKHQGVFSSNLIGALYQRAITRFRLDANFWKDYIEFLISTKTSEAKQSIIPALEAATKRCPTSGELWAHYLLGMEAENYNFQEIEVVKHKATASLQESREGLDDLMTVYIAWCGFLRRRAIMSNSNEDELDIAEVGVRSALENYRKTGEKLLGKDFQSDSQYRLERIHIRLLTQRNDLEGARAIWRDLTKVKSNSGDFWYRWYIWAMVMWGRLALVPHADGTMPQTPPKEPTAVLRQALKEVETLDAPEQLIEMFLNHCEQHETVEEYRTAIIEARSAKKKVAERRERERQEQWAAYYAQQQSHEQAATDSVSLEVQNGDSNKRKREDGATNDETIPKRPRADGESELTQIPAAKRNREQAVIVVKHLPSGTTETKVRQFFRDCGTINSIKLATEDDSTLATVEFETADEARYAQTRASKPFDGQDIEIDFLTGATLWVTNYPPSADEKYIRNLFKDCGEISEVRFPSLQVNTNRRFCYVQFLDAESAKKATALDGKVLDGQFHLSAKISDPNRKDSRHGALYEGREVYVKNVSWKATTDDVQKLFEHYGVVDKVRIPVNEYGKSRGVAFVSFESADDVQKAVDSLNNTPFMSRTITVEQSVAKAKRTLTTVLRGTTHSASPEPSSLNGDAMEVDRSDVHSNAGSATGKAYDHTARKRTMALLDVPDTVNSARLEALLSPFGAINKLVLRPDHGGAIVEFADEHSVGTAGLALTGAELDGKLIRTGTVAELMTQRGELKAGKLSEVKKVNEKLGRSKAAANASSTAGLMRPGVVSRPGAGAGARRGGLGRRSGLGAGASRAGAANGQSAAKSNADFRSMFLKAKENGADEKDGQGDAQNDGQKEK